MTFGPSSSLERIGDYCFHQSGLVGLELPPSVIHKGKGLIYEMDPGCEIKIFVRLREHNNRTVLLTCKPQDKIKDLIAKIEEQYCIHQYRQVLLFAGELLDERNTVHDYQIVQGSTVTLCVLPCPY